MKSDISSARYAAPMPEGGYPDDAAVTVLRLGVVEGRRANDDIEGGGMLAFLAEGGVIEPFNPPTPTQNDYAEAIQSRVDAAAKSRGYGDGYGLASYVTSTIPIWAAEAQTFVAWRDGVWLYAYGELAKVQAGQRTAPAVAEFVEELPPIVWPE